jgi:two-component system OmpR family sensor kinase
MSSDPHDGDGRFLETLQRLLGIRAPELRPALDAASTLVNEALHADKVDVFLYEARRESLVAMGTSDTEVGRHEHAIGMDRLPVVNDGPVVRVFQTGAPYLTGRADLEPDQLPGTVEGLGIRSEMDVPLHINGDRRGVLTAVSRQPDFFTERDLHFLVAVSDWIGLVTERSELVEQRTVEAAQRGRLEAANELAKITRREQQVVSLVAQSFTNAEIAQRLMLVEGTVANHIERICSKLNLRGRTHIAVWAVEHGLYRSDRDESDEC